MNTLQKEVCQRVSYQEAGYSGAQEFDQLFPMHLKRPPLNALVREHGTAQINTASQAVILAAG